jgi:hypothetical protein
MPDLAVIVDTHGYGDVFHRSDDDQCPNDQRQHTKHDIGRGPADGHVEHGLECVQRTSADVAKDNPKRGEAQCGEAGLADRQPGIGVRRHAGSLAHQSKGQLVRGMLQRQPTSWKIRSN